jgi:ethanolamine utilization microcompartment shell protein EutS
MLCYGVFTAAAHSALETVVETIRAVTFTPDETAYAYSLVDAALRTHQAVASAGEVRLTYIRRFNAKKVLTGEERVAELFTYPSVGLLMDTYVC